MGLCVRWLNSGWLEAAETATLMASGRHPEVPGGQVRWAGWSDHIRRPDGSLGRGTMIPASVWYIDGADKKILVDTGNLPLEETAEVHDRHIGRLALAISPHHGLTGQLAKFGVAPADIDIVIQTHLHYDHIGANRLFRNAIFLVNERELPWALCPPPYGAYYYRESRHHVMDVLDQIRFVSGDYQVVPGVQMAYTGGHSPGHSIVFVDTAVGQVVITGDAVYTYRSLELDWPQAPFVNLEESLAAIRRIRTADLILVGHDPLVGALFPDGVGDGPVPADIANFMRRVRTTGGLDLGHSSDRTWPRDPMEPTASEYSPMPNDDADVNPSALRGRA
jgi:glyoxylase-like metal-dependent hydrolase (beta-lactamase superfamily II)